MDPIIPIEEVIIPHEEELSLIIEIPIIYDIVYIVPPELIGDSNSEECGI